MILAKDDIEKAVSWWAGKLMDHQPHSIGSDYGPCKMLADAAAEAGIDRANFPFKTTMFFTEKEGVLVRDGYGAPAVRIC